jgi:hypothetical protein
MELACYHDTYSCKFFSKNTIVSYTKITNFPINTTMIGFVLTSPFCLGHI